MIGGTCTVCGAPTPEGQREESATQPERRP